jgi:Asp-tRNA(Asn)/Glu-tRNA(Gln) amidotransferase A subunit family amidase
VALAEETAWLTAWQLRELIGRKELSAVDVVSGSLDRIGALDTELRAFITVAGDRAMEEARKADERTASGAPLPVLHGVPVAVKDEVWTRGIASSAGSLLYRDFVPQEDGEAARRLRDAGAVIVGKTNMPEFAAFSRSKCRIVGESVNPYDPGRTSGASSGGSAAALAAGMVPIAVGSDGGGSIRIPVSLCGAVGPYPTVGRVPDRGSYSYSPYASLGPMGRDVRDVGLLLGVLAGDATVTPLSVGGTAPSWPVRIGFTADLGFVPVSGGIVELVRRALDRLADAGALVEDIDLRLERVWETFFVVSAAYGRYHEDERPLPFTLTPEFDAFRRRPENFERLCPYTQAAMSQPLPTASEYAEGKARQQWLATQFEEVFARYDVIVSPTMHVVAPEVDEGWGSPYDDPWMGTPFTAVVNMLRLTAISYPVGILNGMPVGLQVIGRARDEAALLQVCERLEAVQPWTGRPGLRSR